MALKTEVIEEGSADVTASDLPRLHPVPLLYGDDAVLYEVVTQHDRINV